MVKTTKRSRKFTKTGGVHKRIEKGGTITKKGKLRLMNRKNKKLSKAEQKELDTKIAKKEAVKVNKQISELSEQEKTRQENDFLGDHNLKNLDMDAFLNAAVDNAENDKDDDNEGDDISMESESDQDEDEEEEESKSMDSDQKSVNSDMDDEEDLDAAEKRMQERLEKLESDDPEFHKFLKDNDTSLLQFGKQSQDDDPNESEEEEEENDEESNNDKDTKQQQMEVDTPSSNSKILDQATLKKIEKSAFDAHGIKGLKRVILAYKIACHLSDTNQEALDSSNQLYQIESSTVFDRLMVVSLTRFHEAFHYHLIGEGSGIEHDSDKTDTQNKINDDKSKETPENMQQDENIPLNPRHLAKAKNWREIKKILQAFFKSTNHLLKEVKESKLLTFIIRCLSKYIRYLTPFPTIAKNLLQTLTAHWCAPFQNESDHIVRLHAFLRIRQLALTQPFPFIEDCLKVLYLAYAKTAKFLTESSLPTLTFLGNCLVEMYSLDIDSSYQHAFIYIRQLALHLRTALQKKTKESFQAIYCWQYFNCLKVWTAILAANPAENELQSLFYPLTEIIFGVSRLLPSTRHLPLRLHCVRLLQQLAAASEMFIPTTPILFEALDLKELYMKPKKSGGKSGSSLKNLLRLPLVLKLPKEDTLRTSDQLDPCVSELFVLLNREVDLYRYSVAFPEFSVRICQRLRKFIKQCKDGRWRAFAKGCLEACDRYSMIATTARTSLNEAPKDIKRLEALKPTEENNMKERYDASIAKEKRLISTTQPRISKKAKAKAALEAKKAMEEQNTKTQSSKSSTKTQKTKVPFKINEVDLKNVESLAELDEVKEGIDWSDDEE